MIYKNIKILKVTYYIISSLVCISILNGLLSRRVFWRLKNAGQGSLKYANPIAHNEVAMLLCANLVLPFFREKKEFYSHAECWHTHSGFFNILFVGYLKWSFMH